MEEHKIKSNYKNKGSKKRGKNWSVPNKYLE